MANRFIGIFFALVGILILYLAISLPQPIAATRIAYGPGFFPKILGAVILLCGLLLASQKNEDTDSKLRLQIGVVLSHAIRPLIVIISAAVYILYSDRIGFLIISPFILAILFMIGGVPYKKTLLISLLTPIIIYGLFAKLLLIPLPLGLLTPFGAYL